MDKTASDKGLRLTSEIDDNLPEAFNGDAARLQQILVNLVNNAVKFTDQGSVHVKLFYPSQYKWGIEVSDTGHGIPESEIPYIFDTFRQVEGTATRVHGGFGLGLIHCQAIGQPDEWGDQSAKQTGRRDNVYHHTAAGCRGSNTIELEITMNELALIIEDDEDLASIFAEALRGIGFEVEHVADGRVGTGEIEEWHTAFPDPVGYAPATCFRRGPADKYHQKR